MGIMEFEDNPQKRSYELKNTMRQIMGTVLFSALFSLFVFMICCIIALKVQDKMHFDFDEFKKL